MNANVSLNKSVPLTISSNHVISNRSIHSDIAYVVRIGNTCQRYLAILSTSLVSDLPCTNLNQINEAN